MRILLPIALAGCAPFVSADALRDRADPCAWSVAHAERGTLLDARAACDGHWTIAGDRADDAVGGSLASVGDLDGDGRDDLAVGAPDSHEGRGAVHVFGAGTLFDTPVVHLDDASWVIVGETPGDRAGAAYASLDSRDGAPGRELVVGAPGVDDGGSDAGLVVLVTTTEWATASRLEVSDPATRLVGGSRYRTGAALAVIDSVDDDAFEELLVGSTNASMGAAQSGTVSVAHSSAWGLGTTSSIRDDVAGFPYVTADSGFGGALATYDGDPGDDRRSGFVVGAPTHPSDDWFLWGQVDWGRAWLFGDYAIPDSRALRPVLEPYSVYAVNLRAETVFSYTEEELRWRDDDARIGSVVAVVPDMDGGGRDEIVLGGSYNEEGDVVAFLVRGEDMVGQLGTIFLIEDRAAVRIVADRGGLGTVPALAGVHDVDGDGRGDLLVGDPNADGPDALDVGRVHVFGSADLFPVGATGQRVVRLGEAAHVLDGRMAGARFGAAIAEVGDLDGDGIPEIGVGAPGERTPDADDVGRVVVFRGGR